MFFTKCDKFPMDSHAGDYDTKNSLGIPFSVVRSNFCYLKTQNSDHYAMWLHVYCKSEKRVKLFFLKVTLAEQLVMDKSNQQIIVIDSQSSSFRSPGSSVSNFLQCTL